MSGINQFTERAQRVLSYAAREAANAKAPMIGTEHLLAGLLLVEDSTAGTVLADLNITIDAVREWFPRVRELDAMHRMEEFAGEDGKLSLAVQNVLRRAIMLCASANEKQVSTEFLLKALLQSPESHAIRICERLGIRANQIRLHLDRILREGERPKRAAAPVETAASVHPARPQGRASERKKGDSPLIDQLSVDLTAKAAAGKLDPVVGRKTEIERLIQILARRTKNNPALIGEPGVGKTAIVEGLAQAIIQGLVPAQLLNKRVLQLDVGSMVAGTMYRGQFEERMKRVIEELKTTEAILFIDEVHMLVGAGSSGSAVDAANILKPALSRGEIQIIGATTTNEYRKNIENDAALERRFQPIQVSEPTPEEAVEILKGLRTRYEDHHQLLISDAAVEAAVKLSVRYVSDRFLPDKAIDLIDEAASRVRLYKNPAAARSNDLISMLRDTRKQIHLVSEKGGNENLTSLRETERRLEADIVELNRTWDRAEAPELGAEDIAEVISMWTGIPLTQLAESESDRLLQMDSELKKMIIGQDEAINAISSAVRRSRSGLKDPNRPIGSFMFLGPTGVGKTELTKALAKYMFGSEEALIQIDMSEFMERHTTSRLTGAPPGYVGFDDAGQLTEAVRRRPYSIVVFDELDKAHPEVQNILLQIMEEGRLTDAHGKKVDFRNTIIVMTSNVGAELIRRQTSFGFTLNPDAAAGETGNYEEMRRKLLDQLKKAFRPEFINRLDNVIVFRTLSMEDMRRITEMEIEKLNLRLADQGLRLIVSPEVVERLTREGYDPEMGARPIRRVIQREVEDKLADALLANGYPAGTELYFTLDDAENPVILPGLPEPVL